MLTPIGGVRLPVQTAPLAKQAKLQAKGTRVYLRLPERNAYTLRVREGDAVLAGTLLATEDDGTPIYSSVSGTFGGIFVNGGHEYLGVVDDAEMRKCAVCEPETRDIQDISPSELRKKAELLGILDIHAGDKLCRTVAKAFEASGGEPITRLVINAFDVCGGSFTNYIQATQMPGDLIGGAKLLARMLGAGKIVLLVDADHPQAYASLKEKIGDNPLFVLGKTVVCYPMTDEMILEMLYGKRLPKGVSPASQGMFLTDAQTVAQFCSAMLTGIPQTMRWLTAAGDGFAQQAVLQLPLGTPWQNVLAACKFKDKEPGYAAIVNSSLRGKTAKGVCEGNATTVIAAKQKTGLPTPCICCGQCAFVCPVWLQPMKILYTKKLLDKQILVNDCIGCGCCDYACPSLLPLSKLIAEYQKDAEGGASHA